MQGGPSWAFRPTLADGDCGARHWRYRLWYELAEISRYVRWFRSSHEDTDAAEGRGGLLSLDLIHGLG